MNRTCGTCTLCCRLLPVRELHKAAGERCAHQRHGKGCAIYADRPFSCVVWSCRWLMGQDTENLPRPDRSHYVIDCMPDYVTLRDNETGATQRVPVLQIWVDPRFPDAHRDPAFRAYLFDRAAAEGLAALIRFNERDGCTVWAPPLTPDGEWHEIHGGEHEPQHEPMPVHIEVTQ